MLIIMIREFIAVCNYLEKSNAKQIKGYLIIERSELEKLLDKNKYLTALEKLKHWKAMNWIDADDKQTTKKVCIDGQRKRCVKLCISVYKAMKELMERAKEG
ncbi:MAG: hypothetical protein J6C33_08870 [Lachnospiraceae bacterium]|nr:hypothetical protein [Lachnospiraceae bacterium]